MKRRKLRRIMRNSGLHRIRTQLDEHERLVNTVKVFHASKTGFTKAEASVVIRLAQHDHETDSRVVTCR
jgi:hypothetical protein